MNKQKNKSSTEKLKESVLFRFSKVIYLALIVVSVILIIGLPLRTRRNEKYWVGCPSKSYQASLVDSGLKNLPKFLSQDEEKMYFGTEVKNGFSYGTFKDESNNQKALDLCSKIEEKDVDHYSVHEATSAASFIFGDWSNTFLRIFFGLIGAAIFFWLLRYAFLYVVVGKSNTDSEIEK